jgi:dolichol-phosphate mannosyltransferase
MKNNENNNYSQKLDISFVIPVYNEEENIKPLYDEIKNIAPKISSSYEIIFVDDASTDNSLNEIKKISQLDQNVKYISFLQNRGQSAALYAGFQKASKEVIITLDADLQNDPNDIPEMLKFYGKYDMINGWRKKRKDSFSKKIGSKIGNFIRNKITGEEINDTGCGLKVMKTSILKKIKMYKGLHRFLPTLMKLEGARVIEIPVNHRERKHGVSKYNNIKRAIEGFYDLIAVRWMIKRHIEIKIKEEK